MAQSEAQKRANAKWEANNREHRSYLSKRSTSRAFIRNRATKDDLIELSNLIEDRMKEFND